MSTTVVVGCAPTIRQRVEHALSDPPGSVVHAVAAPLPRDAATVLAALPALGPVDVLVLGPEVGTERCAAWAAEFAALSPHASVVLFGDLGTEAMLAALRAGVRDVLPLGAGDEEIRTILHRAAATAVGHRAASTARQAAPSIERAEPTVAPRVITIISPKGGVGKTTVATNLAVGLSAAAPNSTVIVDLDVQFGDVASGLHLDPEHSVLDAVHASGDDSMVLKTFLTPHSSDLYALCAPEHPAGADQVSGDDVAGLLRQLSRQFRFVVVDTSAGLSEHTLGALERTTDLLLLCGMDVPSVRAMRKELDVLEELGLGAINQRVVVNSVDNRSGLTIKDIEAMLACPVDVTLPRSRDVPLSTNSGVPLLAAGSRGAAAKELAKLVALYAPAPPRKRSLFQRGPAAVKGPAPVHTERRGMMSLLGAR